MRNDVESKHLTLSSPCYTIVSGAIIARTLGDFDRYIETSTRPTGIGPKYYVISISNHRYALAYWMTWNGPQRIIETFETLAEAELAAEKTYIQDILDNEDIAIFLELSDAERALAQEQDQKY